MFDIDKFTFSVEKEKDDYAHFVIGPFPQGYGNTVGNALRRILLSSIQGAAITSVKIAGIKHEYSTIEGVMQDVLTILLRLKKLAITCHSDEPQTITLKAKGKKVLTAKDITLTSDVEIANTDVEIAELTDSKAKIDIEMMVERGTGYVDADEEKRRQVGTIPLDANFSPVERVVLSIDKTRVGQQTNLDQINLEVYTKGSSTPEEVLQQAVDIYYTTLERLQALVHGKKLDEETEEETEETEEKEEDTSSSSDLDIDKLNLSARLTNSLLKAGYKNLIDLEGKSLDEIMEIRGLGQRSAEELVEIMRNYKLEVKESV